MHGIKELKILGLDLSLTSSGISVGEKTFTISSKKRGAERLSEVSKTVLLTCLDEKIDCVIIEGYSFASRNSQAHSIGELGGCVRMLLWENSIPYIEVPPTSRAKFATGRGNAGKSEVISSVSSKTGRIFSGSGADDECDAWVLEQMGMQRIKKSKYSWSKEQLSSMDKIDWLQLDKLLGDE